jgi:hypothetical protein
MRLLPASLISCSLMLLSSAVSPPLRAEPADSTPKAATAPKPASTATKPAGAAAKSARPLNDNPQIRRNNVDSTVTWSDAVKESKDMVRRMLVKVVQATPKPGTPYELSTEDVTEEIGAKTGMVKGTQHWVPIVARATREYQVVGNDEAIDDSEDGGGKFFEIQVALNSTVGLTTGIATKSDKPHIVEIEGAMAVEQSSFPIVDSTKVDQNGGQEKAEPMTLLRVYVLDPDLEAQARKLQKETGGFPGFGPTQVLADHPDEIRSIVISFYGLKSDVDGVMKKIDVAALRKLLPS